MNGKRNTKSFHTSVLIRWPKNKVRSLKNSDGVWVEDAEQLKCMAREFYKNLYMAEPGLNVLHGSDLLPMLSHAGRRLQNKSVTLGEVKKALFNIEANKVPGSDGFLPAFFQHYRDILQFGSLFRLLLKRVAFL